MSIDLARSAESANDGEIHLNRTGGSSRITGSDPFHPLTMYTFTVPIST